MGSPRGRVGHERRRRKFCEAFRDALFDRTFSVTGNARKSRRAKPPDVSRTPPLRRRFFRRFFEPRQPKETREEETRTGLHTLVRARATDERPRWLRSASPRSSRCVCTPCASALASIAPESHAAAVFRAVRARRAKRSDGEAWRGVPRFEAPRKRPADLTATVAAGPRPSEPTDHDPPRDPHPQQDLQRIPRHPAAPGRGRTMTFSTGTPPSSDLRTRLTRVAFSSWPFTCVSPPARRRRAPRERDPERASARAGNSDARSARASASTPPVADPAPAPRLSSPAIWQRETELFVFSPARAGTRRRSLAFFSQFSQKAKRHRPKRRA